jgi:hypothetical protein
MDLLILPAGLLAGVVAWIVFCAVANWVETGRFRRAVRRG